jgi:outer membrane protein assembly factor BamB
MNSRCQFCASLCVSVLVGLCQLQASAGDWPMFGRDGTRNAVSPEKNPPLDWSIGTYNSKTFRWKFDKTRNIKWRARLGNATFGTPIVAGGHVYIGTNGSGGHVKHYPHKEQYGYLLCFRATDGKLLWQYSAKELEKYGWFWTYDGLGSSPLVEGNRLWFVSNRWEVICLDTQGFHDGQDDGPIKNERVLLFKTPRLWGSRGKEALRGLRGGKVSDWLRGEFDRAGMRLPSDAKVSSVKDGERWMVTARVHGARRQLAVHKEWFYGSLAWLAVYKTLTSADKEDADVVWRYDLRKELKVHPYSHIRWNPNWQCSPVSYGNRLYVVTGNGTEQRSSTIPSPKAPSLVCFDKKTGKVLWTDASPGENILKGQFSSPLVAEVNGRAQVIVGQGDGWVRSFDAVTGKLIWKFDINAKESYWGYRGTSPGTRNSILATPVFYKGRVYVGSGQVAEFNGGPGRLVCIDPTKTGDISSELAMDAKGRPLAQRRFQAVVRTIGEKAIRNPNSGLIWEFTTSYQKKNGKDDFEEMVRRTFHRTISSVVVKNDLLIAVDSELVHCFDARTGKRLWVFDTYSECTGSPLIVDEWVYVADNDGTVSILRLSANPDVAMKKVKGEYRPRSKITMDTSINGSPVFAHGVLYIASRNNLWAIAKPAPARAIKPRPLAP